MTGFRLLPRSLFAKLGLYFVALSLPALLLVESSVIWFEFREFSASVDRGAMQAEVGAARPRFARIVQHESGDRARLDDALASWLLRLERPRIGIGAQNSYVLLELASEPLSAAIFGADGTLLAAAPAGRDTAGMAPDRAMLQTIRGAGVQRIASADSPDYLRRYAVALGDGAAAPLLVLELRVPLPWQRMKLALSFEWPLMLAFLLLFATAAALFIGWYVTRRLHAIEHAVAGWRRGDFSRLVVDSSDDELGRLAQRLNRMARDLHTLVDTRTELAAFSERARLARDLHDTVKQKAFALSLQLGTLQARIDAGAAAGAPLAQARRLAEDIQRELAQILDELRPPERSGFAARLTARAQAFARESGIAMRLAVEDADQVPEAHQETLARALDEALANAMRHSGAQTVVVALTHDGARFLLAIRDDGCGIDGTPTVGRGLVHLRERAQVLPGGRFEWSSRVGNGFEARLSWRSDPQTAR